VENSTINWDEVRAKRAVVPAHVVFRAFPHETVLLNVRTGQYHSVDPVGTRFLEVLREAGDVQAASRVLADEYGQPLTRIETDMAAFVAEMHGRGLVELVGSAG
jgi:hypothetical protein